MRRRPPSESKAVQRVGAADAELAADMFIFPRTLTSGSFALEQELLGSQECGPADDEEQNFDFLYNDIMNVCVCVCERERERGECVCVYVCVCESE